MANRLHPTIIMACNDSTPWTITNHPFTVNRLRVTAGGNTNQSTGEWTPESTSSVEICGSIGRGKEQGTTPIMDGQFVTSDKQFSCHSDCDVALNDIIEAYDDVAGTTKTYWRVISEIKELTTFKNLQGYGRTHWMVRMEER